MCSKISLNNTKIDYWYRVHNSLYGVVSVHEQIKRILHYISICMVGICPPNIKYVGILPKVSIARHNFKSVQK